MVRVLLQALREEAKHGDPARFQPVHHVLYAQPVADEEQAFGTTSVKSIIVRKDSEIFKKVADLVPWEMTRIQAAVTPDCQLSRFR